MDKLIDNFSVKAVTNFFKNKISSFSPNSENLDYILNDVDFEYFSNLKKIGEVAFNNSDELIVFTCKFQGVLSERSSKKRQFEIAKKVLKEDFKDGAIFIFYDDNDCFRFSFIRKNYGNKDQKFTNWKRFTYFVDPARTNKTFKNRINGCNFSSLEDIQEAFSVEKLNKKFYEEIATAFYSLIGGKVSINKKEVSFDAKLQLPSTPLENRKVYQEFAVRLIGRTIFCWFLKNKKSGSGLPLIPEEWLSSNMVASVNNDQHNYYHSILEKLFFLVLNKKHEDRKPYVLPNNHEFVPFLNGGLFEAQDDDFFPKDSKGMHSQNFALNIPNQWFQDFFETLEQYNFTIEENSINDFEVSIDPEMLGTIFENLLAEIDPDTEKSARKSTGSFYTPREIVDYMVEQSLLQYIKTKANIEESELEVLLKDDSTDLTTFQKLSNLTNTQKEQILQALSEVKILDPACGSGAFPMGVLHKIIALLKKLDENAVWWKAKQLEKIDNALVRKAMETKLNQANSDYIRKLGVIQHSIYGVDIQPIAAEISKLRSFLSLIIDENIDDNHPDGNRGIEPLPNLEFKFVTANTLIGLEKGNMLGKDMTFDFGETSELQNQLQQLRNTYLQASPQEKENLKQQFEKLQTQIYKNELKAGGQNKRAQQLAAWKPFSNDSSTWFDADWMFGVEKFDIVIGNPPYKVVKSSDKKVFSCFETFKCYELYSYFFEKCINEFLTNKGVISFITASLFVKGIKFESLRIFLENNIKLNYFEIKGDNVFNNVQMPTAILIGEKLININLNWSFKNFFQENKILDKIENHIVKLKNISSILRGFEIGRDKVKNEGDIKFLTGSNIEKFGIKNFSYINEEIKKEFIKSEEFFNGERILIRETGSKITCLYIEEQLYSNRSLYSIKINDTKFKTKYILALLNSSLIQYYYENKFKSETDLFPKIRIIQAKDLPIKELNDQQPFITIADKILSNKKQNLDTTDLETKIDIMVYKLYELSYEEVLVVAPEFSLSEKEYDGYKI